MIEHADFLDQAQRMVERHRPDERPEPEPLGALGDRGQKDAGRWRHAERRRMMLGHVIAIEARPVVRLRNAQAILVIVRERAAAAGVSVEMIENSKFHAANLHRSSLSFLRRWASMRRRNAFNRIKPSASR